MPSSIKACLVALNCGLEPYARPLVCDDLRGQRSLFGESFRVPRPLGRWNLYSGYPHTSPLADALTDALLLWDEEECAKAAAQQDDIACGQQCSRHAEKQPYGKREALSLSTPVYIAGRCTSTFGLAWALIQGGILPPWGAVLASCQTEGRGQLRREWQSPRGNLYASFRLPEHPLLRGDAASVVTGFLIVQALRDMGFSVELKWPNDIVYCDSKVGGVLLEERGGTLVAGLGVNLCEAPVKELLREGAGLPAGVLLPEDARAERSASALLPASDQEILEAEPLAPFFLWRALVSGVVLAYSRLLENDGAEHFFSTASAVLAWKGRRVLLAEDSLPGREGVLEGIGASGGVLLRLPDGRIREFFTGSLTLA